MKLDRTRKSTYNMQIDFAYKPPFRLRIECVNGSSGWLIIMLVILLHRHSNRLSARNSVRWTCRSKQPDRTVPRVEPPLLLSILASQGMTSTLLKITRTSKVGIKLLDFVIFCQRTEILVIHTWLSHSDWKLCAHLAVHSFHLDRDQQEVWCDRVSETEDITFDMFSHPWN